ncbi:hypothetical protein G6F55_008523 [Rhizopus delemar]|nr:hypothetical protein G6F55_008523 [Rhizopus delemar]KAG1520101.1 hypothetical protein G6F52_007985 [Rhizopus delemar]KAG1630206.1 hypothetical protein G6F45_005667 [Rhizopus arrhizus]
MSFYLTLKEYNAYYFQGSTLDTRIKHKALHIFNSTKSGMELTGMQRYWMKRGLSSILDLVNPKSTQAFLRCEEQDWHRANGRHAHLGTVHLTELGLHTAIYQGIIHFPQNLASFHDFKKSLTLIFMMIFDLNEMRPRSENQLIVLMIVAVPLEGQSTVKIRG